MRQFRESRIVELEQEVSRGEHSIDELLEGLGVFVEFREIHVITVRFFRHERRKEDFALVQVGEISNDAATLRNDVSRLRAYCLGLVRDVPGIVSALGRAYVIDRRRLGCSGSGFRIGHGVSLVL